MYFTHQNKLNDFSAEKNILNYCFNCQHILTFEKFRYQLLLKLFL